MEEYATRTNHETLRRTVLIVTILQLIALCVIFFTRHADARNIIADSEISRAFEIYPVAILIAVTGTVALSIPAIIEMVDDSILNWSHENNNQLERYYFTSLVFIPGVIYSSIAQGLSRDLPFICSCIHDFQYAGCLGGI